MIAPSLKGVEGEGGGGGGGEKKVCFLKGRRRWRRRRRREMYSTSETKVGQCRGSHLVAHLGVSHETASAAVLPLCEYHQQPGRETLLLRVITGNPKQELDARVSLSFRRSG